MPLQNFVAKVGPAISAAWLNSVDVLKFTVFGDATTSAQARANLTSDAPLEVGSGGTGTRGSGASFLAFLASFFPSLYQYINPITQAETAASLTPANYAYPPGNVLRYGLVPNDVSATAANTAALTALLLPTVAGPVGSIVFPNTTGADIYYFGDLLAIRDGCQIDLQWCTLQFTKAANTGNENLAGFLTFIRNVSVSNGTINVNYTGGASKGSCICIGARGSEGGFFPNTYDSTLSSPQGNCRLSNLILSTNNPLGLHIQLTGGLHNTILENIAMNGQGAADGINYEFGWATSGTTNLRQTAHAVGLIFRNIFFRNGNVTGSSAGALVVTGAYNTTVDNLYVDQSGSALTINPGEALFYRPWAPVDIAGAKHNVSIRNIVASRIANTAMNLSGAGRASGTYLAAIIAALSATAQSLAQTNLLYATVEGFALDGSVNAANGYGMVVTAGSIYLRRGYISPGFQRGIVLTDECTMLDFDQVIIAGCTQQAIQMYGSVDGGAALWSPQRNKKGRISRCYLGGNSTAVVGGSPGMDMKNVDSMLITGCFIGYDATEGGSAEATQGDGILIDSSCTNVICDSNRVNVAPGVGAFAYHNTNNTPPVVGNIVKNASGTTTIGGLWADGVTSLQALTYSASMTMDASTGGDFAVIILDGAAHTYNAPLNPRYGQKLTLLVKNTFGAAGAATFNAIFKMSAWTQPANGFSRSITWRWNNVNWVQVSQTGVDVPN